MATIADTLNDIQRLQDVMSDKFNNRQEFADSQLVRDLTNYTTVYFFSLLSHATLDALRNHLLPIRHPDADKYYSLYKQAGLLRELIRLDNISGMFVLWNIFEQYIDRTRSALPGTSERNLEDRYKCILRHINVGQPTYTTMINEFNLIRLTRNSLHNGGVYRNSRRLSYVLKGKHYSLETGKSVTPLRIMDVVETLWDHFVTIANGFRSRA